jgi:hypothetical protein
MAKRKMSENAGGEAAAKPDIPPEHTQAETELPFFQSPPVSPAKSETDAKPDLVETTAVLPPANPETSPEPAPTPEPITTTTASSAGFILRPRHKRHALLAASVAIAAAFGAVIGATATASFVKRAPIDVAVEENKATQQSVARLAREVAGLKASLEAANKAAHAQIAKITERLSRESADNTASVTPPQTVPAAPQPVTPLPAPRPTTTAIEPPPPRLSIVSDWSIREARDGYVYVQGFGRNIYQVVPGAPLPGLGPVEQIKRQDGHWMVVTPKGIIVSMRDRRYFEQF